jgi:hypothetical protein
MAPTFGRLCDVSSSRFAWSDVGAAEPCEAMRVNLWRERTEDSAVVSGVE